MTTSKDEILLGGIVRDSIDYERENKFWEKQTMKKTIVGIILGIIAGILDVIPMIIQGLTWDANISAFTMWIIVGFLIAAVDLKIKPILKGVLIAFLVLLPSAILIGWKEPVSLIPITLMTVILGASLGFFINKYTKNNNT